MTGNILIVDDDFKVLEILEKSLSKKGHEVSTANDGASALESYEVTSPDIVVLDLMLPDMDGREVLRAMRNRPGGENVSVLILSANSDKDTRIDTISEGADDFLTKPFCLRELNTKIDRVLGRAAKTRAFEKTQALLEGKIDEQDKSAVLANRELKKQILSMKTLFAVSQDLNRRFDIEELINGMALSLMGELQVSSMAFFDLKDDLDEFFAIQEVKGFDKRRIDDLKIRRDSDIARWVMVTNRPRKLARNGSGKWSRRLPDIRLAVFEYVTPVVVKQELRGLVFTGPKLNGNEYKPFEIDLLASLCNSAGTAMEHARLFQQLENTYLSTVKALMSIVEAKDAYTKGHTERVADYAVALGKKMELGRKELRDLAFAAVLHDIGKLVVFERVLNKPGALDDEEWEILKSHPEIGASIIENMEFLADAVPFVRHHHERYDGNGYPNGLTGEEIPFGARIITVADAFDAMTTDRSYRKALSREIALNTMIAKAGSQFDPKAMEAFMELIEIDDFHPRQNGDSASHDLL